MLASSLKCYLMFKVLDYSKSGIKLLESPSNYCDCEYIVLIILL